MSEEAPTDAAPASTGDEADVPEWDDEYLDWVADNLKSSFDLEQDHAVHGTTYPLYGRMLVKNQKQFFVAALRYGYHESTEHLFVQRADDVTVADLEAAVDLGHDLADDWITVDDDHFETLFTFAWVVPEISDDVRAFVEGFKDRELLNYGFGGHYEVSLVVAAPDEEAVVASEEADVARAFDRWDVLATPADGLLDRLRGLVG
jgi:hypothetical protein